MRRIGLEADGLARPLIRQPSAATFSRKGEKGTRRRDAPLSGQQPGRGTGLARHAGRPVVRHPRRLGHRAGVGADVRGGDDGGAVGVGGQWTRKRVCGPALAPASANTKRWVETRRFAGFGMRFDIDVSAVYLDHRRSIRLGTTTQKLAAKYAF